MGQQDKGKGSLGKYGPDAIGEEKYKEEQKKLEGSKWKYGPDAVDPVNEIASDVAPPSVPIGPKVVAAEAEPETAKGKKK